MKLSTTPGDIVVTHALGSCLGIAIHDPVAKVGGIVHIMLPLSKIDPVKGSRQPFMFVDTAIPKFFTEAFELGAARKRLTVKVAGGANVQRTGTDTFAIGRRNYIVLKKLFWKNNILIDAEDVGGSQPRTLYLEIGSGRVWLTSGLQDKEL